MTGIRAGIMILISSTIALSIAACSDGASDTFHIDSIDWQLPSEFRKGNWTTLFSIRSNLYENDILDVCVEDDSGAIVWFATTKGLFRYHLAEDRWEIFTVVDGLTDNEFSAVGVSPEYIVAAGKNGLNLFHRQTKEWSSIIPLEVGFHPSAVTEVAVDGDMIWLALSGPGGAVWSYNMDTKDWKRFYLANSLSVNTIAGGKESVFAGGSGGLYVYDKDRGVWESCSQNERLPSLEIRRLLVCGEDLFFGSGRQGVFRLNTRTGELTELNIGSAIVALADNKEYLGIASEEGIVSYNRRTDTREVLTSPNIKGQYFRVRNCAFGKRFVWIVEEYSDPRSVASVTLPLSPVVPQEGTKVWESRYSEIMESQSMRGCYLEILDSESHTSRLFEIERPALPRSINSIAVSGDILWVAGQGFASYDSSDGIWNTYPLDDKDTTITALALDGNDIWYTTEKPECAIYIYSMGTGKTRLMRQEYTTSSFRNIGVIEPDGDYIWFGGQTGVMRYDKRSREWDALSTSLHVQSIALDGQRVWVNSTSFPRESRWLTRPEFYQEYARGMGDEDSIWMVTEDGVWIYSKPRRQWADLVVEGSSSANHEYPWLEHPRTIVSSGENVWLGTSHGLIRYEKSTGISRQYTVSDGLLDDSVEDIAIGDHFIWVLTRKGICGLDSSKVGEITAAREYRTKLNYSYKPGGQLPSRD